MSYKRFTLNPTKQMLTNPSSTDAAENLKYYPPDFMTARPTIISLFLNSWNISRTPRLTVRAYSSFEPNNVSVWYIFYKTMGNPIYQLEVDFIGVCTSDISCLVPISYYPQAQFSYSQKSDFWGMNISIPGTTNKTFSHSIVFSAFFSTTPKYAGIGFGYIYMKPNFKNLSVTIDNVQAQSIGYTVNCPLGDIYYLNLIGIASNWGKILNIFLKIRWISNLLL